MARMVELAALSSSNTTSHHVHGVEDRIGLCFWAKAGDSESDNDDKKDEGMEQEEDSSSVHTMDTVEFIERLKEYVYTMKELLRAEDEVQVSRISKTHTTPDGTTVKRIIEDLAADKKIRLWRGPLPAPRMSPYRTIGDAIAAAKVSSKTRSNHLSRSSSPNSAQPFGFCQLSSVANLGPTPGSEVNGSGRHLED
jgi:hypothetical protein